MAPLGVPFCLSLLAMSLDGVIVCGTFGQPNLAKEK
jgi:hypothetical protein